MSNRRLLADLLERAAAANPGIQEVRVTESYVSLSGTLYVYLGYNELETVEPVYLPAFGPSGLTRGAECGRRLTFRKKGNRLRVSDHGGEEKAGYFNVDRQGSDPLRLLLAERFDETLVSVERF